MAFHFILYLFIIKVMLVFSALNTTRVILSSVGLAIGCASIPRICARSSPPITAPLPRSLPLDGFVAKYMGDGVLIYFGYRRTHEDDAERAVRAGLGVIDAVGRLDFKSVTLQARVGIATGLVVSAI
jgi:class 3 adenylate cyclase